MTRYEQSRDDAGQPVIKVDGIEVHVAPDGFPLEYVADQAVGIRSLIAILERMDDNEAPEQEP